MGKNYVFRRADAIQCVKSSVYVDFFSIPKSNEFLSEIAFLDADYHICVHGVQY